MAPKVVVVVPTIRPESMEQFVKAWAPLFEKHKATLITVWDGDTPRLNETTYPRGGVKRPFDADYDYLSLLTKPGLSGLFCRRTDACRNLGFVAAAKMLTSPDDVVITLDDDVAPLAVLCDVPGCGKPHKGYVEETRSDGYYRHVPCTLCKGTGEITNDPIQAHIDALNKRVPLSWMNTAHDTDLYLRGVPYGVRDEAPVMMSHGVWVGTPDFDGETQLRLEGTNWKNEQTPHGAMKTTGVPYSLPYFVGPIPRGVMFPICGMNLAVKRDALPYLYFAPMGPDSGVEGLHRFADIWLGAMAKRAFDSLGWAVYTGASTILHTRKSDAQKNYEQEKLGREWNERIGVWAFCGATLPEYPGGTEISAQEWNYFRSYGQKRLRFADLVTSLLERKSGV